MVVDKSEYAVTVTSTGITWRHKKLAPMVEKEWSDRVVAEFLATSLLQPSKLAKKGKPHGSR